MPKWGYAAVKQHDHDGDASLNGTGGYGPSSSSAALRDSMANERQYKSRRDLCLGFVVLLAIVYVLARAGSMEASCDGEAALLDPSDLDMDLGPIREARLRNTPPHIIECREAGEGGSQQACHISRDKRYAAVEQKGVTLWMTGLSGSGKSTIAKALEEELVLHHGKHVYRLDGDNIRTGLNRDLGFSPSDRGESVRRVGELACLFADAGTITIVSLVSPYRDDRDLVRKRHEEQGLKFLEVFMDVPLEVVSERDPKGLYDKVRKGELKGFTGVDAPYEAPVNPEINLPNYEMSVEECVTVLLNRLRYEGVLDGMPASPVPGLPPPDGGSVVDLHVSAEQRPAKLAEAQTLPKILLTDVDINWLQTIGEGWAAPLRGFMREGELLQAMHFNSYLVDPFNITGTKDLYRTKTNFNAFNMRPPPTRVSMSVPIVLPATQFTKDEFDHSGKHKAALVNKYGDILGVIHHPEFYENRKEEIVTRFFGVIDTGHPYIAHINSGGDWLVGGEIELLDRIRYNDGLDRFRLTVKELMAKFAEKGTDAVYAFQTRNPTHAGHAYLMRTAREKLMKRGFKNPVLWLSPLGGWTKFDDVPLDVRVNQHEKVLEAGMLDPETTVMAIWPAPMIYAGPTEVQFHAKSRRNAGASFFVVGRDPAGMKGSELAVAHPDDDLYAGDHGRYVLQMSPALGDMEILSFDKVYYDKSDHTMKAEDPSRPDDFISISGSKMRALARGGAVPCDANKPLPSDLLAANCVPPGFMVPRGWDIVTNYYQHAGEDIWVPWSRQFVTPTVAPSTHSAGTFGTTSYALYMSRSGRNISPWHDLPLLADGNAGSGNLREAQSGQAPLYNMVVEIPRGSTAKMEMAKDVEHNPIMQDTKNGQPRYYTYGSPFFNYGFLPRTWEDPSEKDMLGHGGDNDPIDVMELSSGPMPMGTIVPVKVLGLLKLIDEGEVDHKVLAIRADDPIASQVNSLAEMERHSPRILERLIDWLTNYKTSDGKPPNMLASTMPETAQEARNIIQGTAERYDLLMQDPNGKNTGFFLHAAGGY